MSSNAAARVRAIARFVADHDHLAKAWFGSLESPNRRLGRIVESSSRRIVGSVGSVESSNRRIAQS